MLCHFLNATELGRRDKIRAEHVRKDPEQRQHFRHQYGSNGTRRFTLACACPTPLSSGENDGLAVQKREKMERMGPGKFGESRQVGQVGRVGGVAFT